MGLMDRALVVEFLKRIGADVEPTRENVAALLPLARRNAALTVVASEALNDARVRTDEYAAETLRLRRVLDAALAPLEGLSAAGQASARSLAAACVALGVASDSGQLLPAVLAMQERRAVASAERAELDATRAQLAARLEAVTAETRSVEERVRTQEGEAAKAAEQQTKQASQIAYYAAKQQEYAAGLAACEAHLQSVGYDEAVMRHSRLVGEFEALKRLEAECDPLQAELARFLDLEPHADLAKARIDAARDRLALLRAEYAKQLGSIADSADK